MGAYGDFLGVFAELMEDYDVVSCVPRVGGGYDITPVGKINGYIQDGESGLNVRDNYSRHLGSSGSAAGIVSEVSVKYLYTREPVQLFDNFILYEGEPYRAMTDSNYQKEGDLVITEIHKLIGESGINEEVLDIVKGVFN